MVSFTRDATSIPSFSAILRRSGIRDRSIETRYAPNLLIAYIIHSAIRTFDSLTFYKCSKWFSAFALSIEPEQTMKWFVKHEELVTSCGVD